MCRQVRFSSSKYIKMRLRPGLRHGSHWESLQRSPRPLASFLGDVSGTEGRKGYGRGREGRGGKWKVWKERETLSNFLQFNHCINCRLQGCVSSISSPELTHLGSIACPPSDRQPSTSGLATEDRSTWTDMASSWAA